MEHRMGEHKARKGLIRIEFDDENGIARQVKITGDFFMYPEDAVAELEKKMEGHMITELSGIIDEFFALRPDVETPYVNLEDFKLALKRAVEGGR